MFDTHCHLNFEVFDDVLDNVVKNAKDAGVTRLLVPGVGLESSEKALFLASRYPSIYAAVGIHPTVDLGEGEMNEKLKKVEKLADSGQEVVAIGEIGLDFYKYKSPPRVQRMYFIKQLEIAAKLGKSLVIHSRHSSEELLDVLKESWSEALEGTTVFHCVEPNRDLLSFAKKHNVYLGFDGDITYSEDKQAFIKEVPLELLVVETDSPFLTPHPVSKEGAGYNEPKYIPLIVKKIAELIDKNEEDVKKETNKNSLRLFGLV